ncbi:hypothetical protein HRbin01_01071 [archaeon HR01]|nr:hypothetical protein HRbin01_01071 [archaeon HR01]
MCLGVYGKVLQVNEDLAVVDFGGGLVKEALVGVEEVKAGDYVVVHAGVIVSRLNENEFAEVFNHVSEAVQILASSGADVADYWQSIKTRLAELLMQKPTPEE